MFNIPIGKLPQTVPNRPLLSAENVGEHHSLGQGLPRHITCPGGLHRLVEQNNISTTLDRDKRLNHREGS
jgi:hypothetical protein